MENQNKKRKSFYLNYEDEKVFLAFLENTISKNIFELLLLKHNISSGGFLQDDIQNFEMRINVLEREQEVLTRIRNSLDKKYI